MLILDTYRGKKNPADSPSRQMVSDALVRKSSVTDANASYVQKLRVAEDPTDEEIKAALHQLFKFGPQDDLTTSSQDQTGPQGKFSSKYPQGTISIQSSPQGEISSTNTSILASTAISKIQLDDTIKNYLTSALQDEVPYSGVITQLQGGSRQILLNDLTFKFLQFFIGCARPETRRKS